MHIHKGTEESIVSIDDAGKDDENLASKNQEIETAAEKCSECAKTFKHKTSLKHHMKKQKPEPKMFQCDMYIQNFTREDTQKLYFMYRFILSHPKIGL